MQLQSCDWGSETYVSMCDICKVLIHVYLAYEMEVVLIKLVTTEIKLPSNSIQSLR